MKQASVVRRTNPGKTIPAGQPETWGTVLHMKAETAYGSSIWFTIPLPTPEKPEPQLVMDAIMSMPMPNGKYQIFRNEFFDDPSLPGSRKHWIPTGQHIDYWFPLSFEPTKDWDSRREAEEKHRGDGPNLM